MIFLLEFWFLREGRLDGATRMGVSRRPNGSIKPLGILRAGKEDWRCVRKGGRRATRTHFLLLNIGSSLPAVLVLAFHSSPQSVLTLWVLWRLGKDCRVEGGRLVNFDRELEAKVEPTFASLNQLCFPNSLLFLLFFPLSYCPFIYSQSFIHT